MKGNQLRVNQVEIVAVDLAAGRAYGTVWTHIFSPRVERYDVALNPHFANKPISEPDRPNAGPESQRLVGSLGSSGYGLDGMQGRRGQTALFERGYRYSPNLDAIE